MDILVTGRLTMSEVWAKWEGQIINGVFPLRRLLGVSDHSGVFLTEYKTRGLPDAAIKLLPANMTEADTQLAQWRTIAALAHPRLIRLIAMGRCQLDGLQFLFVVMEYAEQNLSQILSQRALMADEVREMLPPILEALAFLHSQQQVQGRLKPTNILAVGDQLKLASDTIRPESDGRFSASRDIGSLGTTIVEALTQHPAAGPDERFDAAAVPADFPTEFADLVRQCVSADPAQRPTSRDLLARFRPQQDPMAPAPTPAAPIAPVASAAPVTPAAQSVSAAQPTAVLAPPIPQESASAISLEQHSGKRRWYIGGLAVALIVWLAVWAGLHGRRPAQIPPPPPAMPAAAIPPSNPEPAPVRTDPGSVLHEEIPEVSASARATIHGRIQVAVRVTLDSAGNVANSALTNPGSSKYFARLATDAAMKWKFAPSDDQEPRKRLLIFEFSRSGAVGHAAPAQP
jgi:Protein kinase domain